MIFKKKCLLRIGEAIGCGGDRPGACKRRAASGRPTLSQPQSSSPAAFGYASPISG